MLRYVGTLAVLALTCVAVSGVAAAHSPAPPWAQVALVVALVAVADLPLINVRVGSDRLAITWTGAAVVAAVTLLPPPWVIPAVLTAGVPAFVRQHSQPVKALFNLSAEILGTALAVGLVQLIATLPVDPGSVRGALALVSAAVAQGLWLDISTSVAIGLSQQRSPLQVYAKGMGTQFYSEAGNLASAIVILALVHLDVRVLLVVPPLLFALRQAYDGRLRGREERESWQGLIEATQGLADLDEQVVLTQAAAAAARLFSADWVEIQLASGRLVRGTEQGIVYDGAGTEAPPRAAHTVIERPLGSTASPVGQLRLCFRGEVDLTEREQAVLGALAAELHSALVNAAQHAKARHQATHDPISGLLNRAGLLDEGQRPLQECTRDEVDAALVLVDLTGFREIIDTLGHPAGDAVLRHTAGRLKAAAMPGEIVGRLDGDDFVVLLPRLSDPAQAAHRAEAMLGAIAQPIEIDGATLSVGGVAGIAYAVRAGLGLDELLRQAGVAVHGVRAGSGGRVGFYAPERDAASVSRLVLASELRTALRDLNELELVYQPIIELHSGEAIAAEALVRWNHRTRGLLVPEEFLPVVEHAGLLPELTQRVFDIALESAGEWSRHGILVPVSINVSPRTLVDSDFPGQVAAALSRHRVPAARVTLEISETSVLSHLEVVDQVLDELRDLGLRLSLDDFGSGWSSLSHLARVPVHEVKLAASFTEGLFSSPQAAAVVRGTLEIARALDLRVVALGVTNPMQRATLVSLGCHAGQGPSFFPPLPADKITPALWSSAMRALAGAGDADVIPLSQRRVPRRDS